MARQILNDGENKGIFRGKLNSNFAELYTDKHSHTNKNILDDITTQPVSQTALTAETNTRIAADNVLDGRIDGVQSSVSALQSEATSKWVLLNTVDNRSRSNESRINTLESRNGIIGEQGPQGERGEDGLSAYEIWLAEGNVGTEQDFLDSLKGVPGEPGDTYNAWQNWQAIDPINNTLDFEQWLTKNLRDAQDIARREWENAETGIEYWTGGYFKNRKKYGKIIDFGALPSGSTKLVAHNISNIYSWLYINAIVNKNRPSTEALIVPYLNSSFVATIALAIAGDNIYMTATTGSNVYDATVTLIYTCTDR